MIDNEFCGYIAKYGTYRASSEWLEQLAVIIPFFRRKMQLTAHIISAAIRDYSEHKKIW